MIIRKISNPISLDFVQVAFGSELLLLRPRTFMDQTDLGREQGSGVTKLIVWTNFGSRCSVWPIPKLGMFDLAHTRSLVWPTPNRWSVGSGSYPTVDLFGLAHIQPLICSVWLIVGLGLFCVAPIHSLVYSV